ncbi:MAG: response regulator [Pseudomonadota bacterium]|nr:response regulator [Pseudomonadota bacterium]MDE3038802.1 response regulator [Pseudomonadota bacterium]
MQAPLEILLVEDNEGDVEMTRRALRDSKPACNVSVANNGIEALNFLHRQGQFSDAPAPQIILLDLNMPRMDGKKFLEIMKEDTTLKAIPVIMLTSSGAPTDIQECYERHANCYVVKPFDGKEFMEAVRQVVSFWISLGRIPHRTAVCCN